MNPPPDPHAAWAAAAAAVQAATGAPVPRTPGVLRGGPRLKPKEAERRRLAIYTAVCGLGVCGRQIAFEAGVVKSVVYETLPELEDRRASDPAVDALLDRLAETARWFLARQAALPFGVEAA